MPFQFLSDRRHIGLLLALPAICGGMVSAGDLGEGSPLAIREIARREAAVQEGRMLLEKGDESYKNGDYREAVAAYAGARDSFPDAPATAELKEAATQRYAQASVELAKTLVRKGDVPGAKEAVDSVLLETVAPEDFSTQTYRAQLDDPIRINPASSKENAADIDQVRRLLYTAQGAYDLGKFDQAGKLYKDVLRIDPYNKAARRGMEQIASGKSRYFGAAYDAARADFLSEVDGSWELPLTPGLVIPQLGEVGQAGSTAEQVPLENKLSRIIIPDFRLEQVTLMEAIELLRLRIAENDTFEADPAKRGINIAVNLGVGSADQAKEILSRTFDLQVGSVPASQILKYITEITGTSYQLDDFAVTLVPAGSDSGEMITRTYRVPPDFLGNLSAGATAEGEQGKTDIFNTEIGSGGLLAKRMGAQEALALQGVSFPEGALASFTGTSNLLRVVNTPSNQDIISQIVESIAQTEPVSVAVRVTMLKVQKNRLEELGFDWMLDSFAFGEDSFVPGASTLNLTGGSTGNGSAISDIPGLPNTFTAANPITAGNRSGDGAISASSIDSLIAAGSGRGRQSGDRAPGVFGVNGIIGSATIQSLMRGLDQKKGVDMMAQPSVTTRSGQAASILIVDEFIYPTEYEPPELPNTISSTTIIDLDSGVFSSSGGGTFPVTPATPTAFEKRDLGITLEVLPVADANRRFVDVTLNPSIVDFDGFVNYGTPITNNSMGVFGPVNRTLTDNSILMPVFNVMKTNSNLIVADGSTIVIGGLMKDEIQDVEDKTPILGDLPIIGRFFQTDVRSHTSTAILFLVNVELLDPTGRPYRDR